MDVLTAEIETTSSALFRILWILSECLDAQESKTTGRSLRLGDRAWMVFRSHLRGEYRDLTHNALGEDTTSTFAGKSTIRTCQQNLQACSNSLIGLCYLPPCLSQPSIQILLSSDDLLLVFIPLYLASLNNFERLTVHALAESAQSSTYEAHYGIPVVFLQ